MALAVTGILLRSDGGRAPLPTAVAISVTAAPTASPTAPPPAPSVQAAPTTPPLVPFPENVVMLVAHGGYAKGSGVLLSLTRHYRDRKGELRADELLKWSDTANSAITGIVSNERGELFASTCLGKDCASEGPGAPDWETSFTRSTDGGVTWGEIARAPGRWWVRLGLGSGAIAMNYDGQSLAVREFPSGASIAPPAVVTGESLPTVFRGRLAWVVGTQIVSASGERLYELELPGYPKLRIQSVLALMRGGPSPTGDSFPVIVASWSADGLPGQQQFFVGTFLPPIGLPLKVVRVERGAPRLAGFLNERDLLVTQEYVRPGTCTSQGIVAGADPAIIAYELGPLSFIGTPFYDKDCSQGSQVIVQAQPNFSLALVRGGGDCVNLRRDPSLVGPVIDCLGDGAIVTKGKGRSNDGARSWQSVVGPSGQQGWIAEEFLE